VYVGRLACELSERTRRSGGRRGREEEREEKREEEEQKKKKRAAPPARLHPSCLDDDGFLDDAQRNLAPECALSEARIVPSDHIASSRHARGDNSRGAWREQQAETSKKEGELCRAEREKRESRSGVRLFFLLHLLPGLVLAFAFFSSRPPQQRNTTSEPQGARDSTIVIRKMRPWNSLSENKSKPT